MSFLPTEFAGGRVINVHDPDLEDHRDVVFVPNTPEAGQAWGVFDGLGRLVPASAFTRGPERDLVMQHPLANMDLSAVTRTAPDETYIYGGALHVHFGHFLLSTLSRFWPLLRMERGRTRIVMNAGGSPADWFAVPHVAQCFHGLGLSPEDFVTFDVPTRMNRLLIPRPSVEEQYCAHRVFAELAHRIGCEGSAGAGARVSTPLYLSKARLQAGVWRFENEQDVVDVLARHGVEIAFPEQLSLQEQVRLFARHETVCGPVGSGLHTQVFVSEPPRIIGYNWGPLIVSNFALLDGINGTTADYLYPTGTGVEQLAPTADFGIRCVLTNPVRTAEDFLRVLDRTNTRGASLSQSGSGMRPASLDSIGLRHGTDKASNHHGFLPVYDRLFDEFRNTPGLKLLEIGVYNGGSVRTWEEHFPNASIIGVDIDPRTLESASAQTTVEIADQSNIADLVRIATTHGPFDIIIDDGSHFWGDQITSLRTLFPFLRPGGYYVVENLDTSYGTYVGDYARMSDVSAADYLKQFLDYLVGDTAYDIRQEPDAFIRSYARLAESVAFYKRMAVIRRAGR